MNSEQIAQSVGNAIKELIAYEPDLNAKLDMLTSIATTTQNDEIWHETEVIRESICTCPDQEQENKKGRGLEFGQQDRKSSSEVLLQDNGDESSHLFT